MGGCKALTIGCNVSDMEATMTKTTHLNMNQLADFLGDISPEGVRKNWINGKYKEQGFDGKGSPLFTIENAEAIKEQRRREKQERGCN